MADIFTMVIMACITGGPCSYARISEMGFSTEQACIARIEPIIGAMTKEFASHSDYSGKAVAYEVACMTRPQMRQLLGVTQSDI